MIKLLLCLFGISVCFIHGTVAREAIIDGELVKNNLKKFSYIVAIRTRLNSSNGRSAMCGGGIIDDKFVLTAAHCFRDMDRSGSVFVTAGTVDFGNDWPPAEKVAVKKIFWPKEYMKVDGSNGDIAVLLLDKPLRMRNHKNWKLHLPTNNHESYENVIAEIAGFGRNKVHANGSATMDLKLRFAQAKVGVNCIDGVDIPKEFLCAQVVPHGRSRPRGVATGDSGSPLVRDKTVIGILSVATKHASEASKTPGIYTRVTHYLNFIRNSMNNEATDEIVTLEPANQATAPSSSK